MSSRETGVPATGLDRFFRTSEHADGFFHPETLTRFLGKYLVEVEALFGPRDPSFTILGIELVDTEHSEPRIWFPPSSPERKHVIVHLMPDPEDCERDCAARLRWQLAHECVHLLDPHPGAANVLEEGLCTWYQNHAEPKPFRQPKGGSYAEALALANPLMDELPDVIRHLRQTGHRIRCITSEVLREACPRIQQNLSVKLTQTFSG